MKYLAEQGIQSRSPESQSIALATKVSVASITAWEQGEERKCDMKGTLLFFVVNYLIYCQNQQRNSHTSIHISVFYLLPYMTKLILK